jgi:hypothetical protein
MKKTLITLMALTGLTFGQSTTSLLGAKFTTNQGLRFGGASSVVLTTGTPDTTSDAFPYQIANVGPGYGCSVAYEAKSTNSATSTYQILVDTKYCYDPNLLSQCDTSWTQAGRHGIYGSLNVSDTLSSTTLTTAFTGRTAAWMIFEHNLARYKIKGTITSGETVTIQGKTLCK